MDQHRTPEAGASSAHGGNGPGTAGSSPPAGPAVQGAPRVVTPAMIFDVEAPDYDAARAFMSQRRAMQAALASERKARAFFDAVLPGIKHPEAHALFLELRDEETQHESLVQAELDKLPPDSGFQDDDFVDDQRPSESRPPMVPARSAESAAAERANSLTHGVGAGLSVLCLVLLAVSAAWHGTARDILGGTVFGPALVVLYTMSTLYHALSHPRAKRVFHILDHSAIYLLIAGTYTPFCLSTLRGGWGWSLFGIESGAWRRSGMLFEAFHHGAVPGALHPGLPGHGLMAVVAALPLSTRLPAGGLAWLLAGGACYSLGVVFYA